MLALPSEAVVWECRSPWMSDSSISFGESVIKRGFHFAAIFAQLGLDISHAEFFVDIGFGFTRKRFEFRRFTGFFLGFFVVFQGVEPPFVQGHFLIEGQPANFYAMFFGAGEIEQSRAEIFGRDDAKIHLQSASGQHAGLGVALAEDAG